MHVWWVLVLVLISSVGCIGHREPDWPSLVGTLTYDQALLELGPPAHVASLSDGSRVAEWLRFSSRVYSTPGAPMGGWGPYGLMGGTTISSTPNVYLLLTFSPDDKLVSARTIYR